MTLTSAIAIYFVVWWLCLFLVLPFGVRNSHEAGQEVAEGHETGAPVNPMLWRKIAATTLLSGIVVALLYGELTYGWIGFEDIPFLNKLPGT